VLKNYVAGPGIGAAGLDLKILLFSAANENNDLSTLANVSFYLRAQCHHFVIFRQAVCNLGFLMCRHDELAHRECLVMRLQ
jgi:hypothetical protein